MANFWSHEFLTRRIDRCYLIAAGSRTPEKRQAHIERARHYRAVLAHGCVSPPCEPAN